MDQITKQQPLHKHDCDVCIFLGSFNGEDLYFHPIAPLTLISRAGEGSHYLSGLPFWNVEPQLGEAARRAVDIGVLTQEFLDQHKVFQTP